MSSGGLLTTGGVGADVGGLPGDTGDEPWAAILTSTFPDTTEEGPAGSDESETVSWKDVGGCATTVGTVSGTGVGTASVGREDETDGAMEGVEVGGAVIRVGTAGCTEGGTVGGGTGGGVFTGADDGGGTRDLDLPKSWENVRPTLLRLPPSFWLRGGMALHFARVQCYC